MSSNYISDERIVYQSLGEPEQYNLLVLRYRAKLHNFLAGHYKLGPEDIEDIIQESFLKAFMNRGKFDAAKKFQTWLFSIAQNKVFDYFRKRQRQQFGAHLLNLETAVAEEPDVDALLEVKKLQKAIGELSSEEQVILQNYFEKGLSKKEIAQSLFLKKEAVDRKFNLILRRLSQKLL